MALTREDGYRAWLTHAWMKPREVASLLHEYGGAEGVYTRFVKEGGDFLREYGFSDKLIAELKVQSNVDKLREFTRIMRDKHLGIMSIDDEIYPKRLRNISDPPALMFYRGNPGCLQNVCITSVGTRNASSTGMDAARAICRELSRYGITIVSGFALGIDKASHIGAMDYGCPTAAVLACGIDVPYPQGNQHLIPNILVRGGVLLSEFPLGMKCSKYVFHVRNRLLSGLSDAVMLMEAGLTSGSLITADHALDQGRELFVHPGIPGTPGAAAAHDLIRSGARFFHSAGDVMEDLGLLEDIPFIFRQTSCLPEAWLQSAPPPQAADEKQKPPVKPKVSRKSPFPATNMVIKQDCAAFDQGEAAAKPLPPLSEDQKKVYELLAQGEKSFDQLAAECSLSTPQLSAALTILRISGLIQDLPGKSYSRI